MGIICNTEFSTQSYCDKLLGFSPITTGEKDELRKILNEAGYEGLSMFSLPDVEEIIDRNLPVVLVDTTYTSSKGLVPEKKWVEVPAKCIKKLHRREKPTSAKRMIISMPGGSVYVDESQDPNYPGVDIEFVGSEERAGFTCPRILMEREKDEDGSYGPLRALIWNGESEDYTDEIVFDYPLGGKNG